MTNKHNCRNHLDSALRLGRAKYACSVCGEDVSLDFILWMEAVLYEPKRRLADE
jgi:hypothetical protein